MATNPWDLMRELSQMQERMNRMWSSFSDREHDDVTTRGSWRPAVDIYETDARDIVLKAELPGVARDDIELTVENNTLTIRGQRRRDEGVPEERYHRVERTYGPFSRSFTLPGTLEAGAVRAEYRDGVLTVKLPVRAEARPRQIQVDLKE